VKNEWDQNVRLKCVMGFALITHQSHTNHTSITYVCDVIHTIVDPNHIVM